MTKILLRAKLAHDKRIYRDLEMDSDKTLYDCADIILSSFDFDFDHLFGFGDIPNDYYGSDSKYSLSPDDSEEGDVEKTKLSDVPFFQKPGDKMSFLFDYGDDWLFEVEYLESHEARRGKPRLMYISGKAPKQYGRR